MSPGIETRTHDSSFVMSVATSSGTTTIAITAMSKITRTVTTMLCKASRMRILHEDFLIVSAKEPAENDRVEFKLSKDNGSQDGRSRWD